MPNRTPTSRHAGAYRRSRALAPVPQPFAFGIGERLVLSFSLPVEEVVRRLSAITVPDASWNKVQKGSVRLVGTVQAPEFRVTLNGPTGQMTQIHGRISTDADMTQLKLETIVNPVAPAVVESWLQLWWRPPLWIPSTGARPGSWASLPSSRWCSASSHTAP
ncbi:MAG: hypothetical protein IPI67_29955 [Myxococcales bacterium]|nr:hypothetical protein [Myxococcales bacterium]